MSSVTPLAISHAQESTLHMKLSSHSLYHCATALAQILEAPQTLSSCAAFQRNAFLDATVQTPHGSKMMKDIGTGEKVGQLCMSSFILACGNIALTTWHCALAGLGYSEWQSCLVLLAGYISHR